MAPNQRTRMSSLASSYCETWTSPCRVPSRAQPQRRGQATSSGPRESCDRPSWYRASRQRSSRTSIGLTGMQTATKAAGGYFSRTKRIETISDDRGPEEIPVLVDFEVQHWIAEALEGATRTTGLIIGRVASMGVHRLNLGRKEAGALDLAASRATQAVMRAATADPLSDAQLERIVKLALGKRVPIASATMGGGDPPQATTPAVEPASNQQAERKVESKDEGESHASDFTKPGESPPSMSRMRPASPELQGTVAQPLSGTPAAQLPDTALQATTTAATQGGKKKSRAARKAARAAREAEGSPPTADGGQAPPVMKPRQCPVCGCTRKHAPSDCPTFLDMTPKERLDLVHAKQLCLQLPATSFERRMQGCGHETQLPSGRLLQATSRDTARSSEGREALPAGEGHRPAG
jgi:hypothetical protein